MVSNEGFFKRKEGVFLNAEKQRGRETERQRSKEGFLNAEKQRGRE